MIYIFSFFPISFHSWLHSSREKSKKDCFTLANTHYQQVHSSCSILASRLQTHTQISMLVTMLWQQFVIKPFTVSPDNLKALLLLVSTDTSFFLWKRRWKTELSRLLNSLGLSNYKKNVSNFACHYNIQQLMTIIATCVTFMYNFYISMY